MTKIVEFHWRSGRHPAWRIKGSERTPFASNLESEIQMNGQLCSMFDWWLDLPRAVTEVRLLVSRRKKLDSLCLRLVKYRGGYNLDALDLETVATGFKDSVIASRWLVSWLLHYFKGHPVYVNVIK